ncbi:polymeric immunoglobulin receptor-like isoform X2 [Chelmon rostratus]|uniref:polymeric immunoglobulin receptor-like isoform X2 n=1 Tax=Chelmon rostratus TaxID=109905 RepID=UPI001BE59894|nr:polymeric immunoglobulin receptor-like isoform X2 [Chelmon rostratus]
MAVNLSFLLILTGLTGIHSITTINRVSVRAGDSISIPCLYDPQFRNSMKYLCKGYYFNSCSYLAKTNQQSSGKFSISDDNDQRIFTVTLNDLMDTDTDYYWCAVEINEESDVGEYFYLSVTRGMPRLYVDHQEITGFNGENIIINCYHRNSGKPSWCRLGSSCVRSSGSIDGARVTIDDRALNVFTVMMTELRAESSGWYACVRRDIQIPVHVTVTEKPTTNTPTATRHLTNLSHTSEHLNHTSVFASEGPTGHLSFTIRLSLLVLFVMMTSFIWLMVRRCKQTKETSAISTEQQEEVRYTRKPSGEVLQPLKGQYVIYNRSKLKHTLGHLKSFVFVLFFRIHTSYKKKQI